MSAVAEADRTGVQDILWTVESGETTRHYTTQQEAVERTLTALASDPDATYGITINVPNENFDKFVSFDATDVDEDSGLPKAVFEAYELVHAS